DRLRRGPRWNALRRHAGRALLHQRQVVGREHRRARGRNAPADVWHRDQRSGRRDRSVVAAAVPVRGRAAASLELTATTAGVHQSLGASRELHETQVRMRKIIVTTNLTLDGVMQAPARADEDTRGAFQHGGWATPFAAMQSPAARAAIGETGALLLGRR